MAFRRSHAKLADGLRILPLSLKRLTSPIHIIRAFAGDRGANTVEKQLRVLLETGATRCGDGDSDEHGGPKWGQGSPR
jgi:hypothetical protein